MRHGFRSDHKHTQRRNKKFDKKQTGCCGGVSNTGKNQRTEGLKYVTNFVKKRKNTNVVIMRMSQRTDLEVLLCADNEVKVFNRKI